MAPEVDEKVPEDTTDAVMKRLTRFIEEKKLSEQCPFCSSEN